MIGFSSSPRFVDHHTGADHPECPDRIRVIHRAVREAGLIDSPDPFPDFRIDLGGLHRSDNPPAKLLELTPTPADESMVRLIHPVEHIEHVKRACELGLPLDPDTLGHPGNYELALLSLGSAITAADAVMTGQVRRAFSAARPPGHHAEPNRAMGFCYFANAAIVAKHIQVSFDVRRVAIVDFDVHHGNGTQACLIEDPSVLFISLHQ